MSLSRRSAMASTAALFAAARAATPYGAFAQGSTVPEVAGAKLGYIPLTDASPVIIAREKGLFAKYGMPNVEVVKQPSWDATRDGLMQGGAAGGIDGAHLLTPMAYLIHTGTGTPDNRAVPMAITARLSMNGQGISISARHRQQQVRMDASPLRRVLTPASRAAMTYTGGTHDLWLRYWLGAAGIDPVRNLRTLVLPPPQMVQNMRIGTCEVFCVGEPWNGQLVNQDLGYTALTTGELWANHPEKALALRADFVQRHPRAAEAITAAVIEAQRWCDQPANLEEMCNVVCRDTWLNVTAADILPRLRGEVNYGDGRQVTNRDISMKFWRDNASYPYRSHDLWFLTELVRWGILAEGRNTPALIEQVNKEAVWRAAAARAGVPAAEMPNGTSRGRETFFDGKVFDPANPTAYLRSLSVVRLRSE